MTLCGAGPVFLGGGLYEGFALRLEVISLFHFHGTITCTMTVLGNCGSGGGGEVLLFTLGGCLQAAYGVSFMLHYEEIWCVLSFGGLHVKGPRGKKKKTH